MLNLNRESTPTRRPGTADFRNATVTMQKAADALMAATEIFRGSFRGESSTPQSKAPTYTMFSGGQGSSIRSPGGLSQATIRRDLPEPPTSIAKSAATEFESEKLVSGRSRTKGSLLSKKLSFTGTTVKSIEESGSKESLSRPPPPAKINTSHTFGAYSTETPELIERLTPTEDWPPIRTLVPDFAATLAAPYSNVKTGPRPLNDRTSYQQHIDLVEAAEAYNANRASYQTDQQNGAPGYLSKDEPASIVQIGEYTYVLSDSDVALAGSLTLGDSQSPSSRDRRARAKEESPKPPKERPHGFSLFHEFCFVLIISLAQMLMLSGIAQSLVPARIIGATFSNTTEGDLAWYTAAYGLTSGTFVLPAGRLGDLYGHKKIFIFGFVWFGIWSMTAGFSLYVESAGGHGNIFFCICRGLQGIGPALLVPNGQAMLGRAYKPGPRKNIVMSLFGAAAPFGFVVGGAMASVFAMYVSWPWAFWTLACMCIALAVLAIPILPSGDPPNRESEEGIWVRLDMKGMLLGVSGLVLLNFSVNQAPIVSWSTPYTYFILIIGVIVLGSFVQAELAAKYPLLPLHAMRAQTNFVLGCTAAGWGCFSIWVYYSFSFLEVMRGWSPLLAAAGNAHGPISGLVASILTGWLFSRRVRPHWIMLASMCAFFAGSLLYATAPVRQSYFFNCFFSVLIMPFGMDMSNPAATILLSNSVSREHQGIAASLVVTVVNYSISFALGIAGTIETHTNDGGRRVLAGYRGAQYFGLGLGALGITLAGAFLLQSYRRSLPPVPDKEAGR